MKGMSTRPIRYNNRYSSHNFPKKKSVMKPLKEVKKSGL